MTPEPSVDNILALVGEYAAAAHVPRPFDPANPRVPASGRVFGHEEVVELVRTSLDFWLTAGPEARVFERDLALRTGQRHALLVNSGSSANLLALTALTSPKLG
ncbi:MAG: CDP-4-dehydro-6-deoxyglucose reductase, partial [Gaiellales bacterium]|nr:CDP-4-dehydro-6-deoxyglucose reductase [Gaiellales bacterium]